MYVAERTRPGHQQIEQEYEYPAGKDPEVIGRHGKRKGRTGELASRRPKDHL